MTVLMGIELEAFEATEGVDDDTVEDAVVEGCEAVMTGVFVARGGAVGFECEAESNESAVPSGAVAVWVIAVSVKPEAVGGIGVVTWRNA